LLCEAVGESGDEAFRRFLGIMADNGRLPLLPELTSHFARLRQEAENRLEVRVVSAVALDDDQAERMKSALAKRFERAIALHNDVDASLLGGAVIYAGDEVIDGSVLGRLQRLQQSLL
jgi:F-type H+-transporting ATPase subunit delta